MGRGNIKWAANEGNNKNKGEEGKKKNEGRERMNFRCECKNEKGINTNTKKNAPGKY